MFRGSLHGLAVGVVAAVLANGEAAAGACCECPPPCPSASVVEVVEAAAGTPFYVVNHGPIYAGPGIVSIPTVHVHKGPRDYPYVGYDGRYHRHHHHEVTLWQKSRMVYIDVKAPRRTVISHGHRITPYRSGVRRMVRPPLDPRDK